MGCLTKTALEDLYLPFKPKRRTRAMIAREKGLRPLALLILQQASTGSVDEAAASFISEEKKVPTSEEALAGARDIIAEMVSENADVRSLVRQSFAKEGVLVSEAIKEKTKEPTKF